MLRAPLRLAALALALLVGAACLVSARGPAASDFDAAGLEAALAGAVRSAALAGPVNLEPLEIRFDASAERATTAHDTRPRNARRPSVVGREHSRTTRLRIRPGSHVPRMEAGDPPRA